ncbi:Hypothetical predicted protein [Olea europaea subsp. europaea]|uniref:Uncharacterized protein n=1 Tax=Olea europaea subsp. europaea TaxID=158383 RepID=A0A8S0PYR2_OLEEU|nr:Hypothetical predicted protein [Olea europaea subsp. europaea]
MDIRRLQWLDKEFGQKATDAEAEAKWLRFKASTADEVFEALRVDELTPEIVNLRQQLSKAREPAMNNYVAHYHETLTYAQIGSGCCEGRFPPSKAIHSADDTESSDGRESETDSQRDGAPI